MFISPVPALSVKEEKKEENEGNMKSIKSLIFSFPHHYQYKYCPSNWSESNYSE